jgi:nitrous oxidase accessory protein
VPAVLAAGLALGLFYSTPASSAVLTVGGEGSFRSVAAALAAAADGDVLDVAPGTYPGRLEITRRVTLRGRGEPHLVGDGEGDVVRVLADGAEISGFAIHGSGRRMMTSDAGVRVAAAGVHLADNRIFDNLFGVYLDGAREALIEGNTVVGRGEDDIGRRGAGIHLYDAHHNVIRGNHVRLVRDGVYFDHSDSNTVEDNEFRELRYGVHYMYCDDNRFFGNVFRDSVAGVAIMYSRRVVFADNLIVNNRTGFNAFGLLLKECEDSVAERNVIVDNGSGIFLDGAHRNRFRHNLVAYNDVGVLLYASALGNSFGANDFIGNLADLHTVGRAEADWTPGGEGNYYSGYAGFDLDGDGRGDVPHRLQDAFEVLEGNHPLLRLFLSSAAADALAAAETAFPILPGSRQWDTAPAMKPVSGLEVGSEITASTPAGRPAAAGGWLVLVFALGWSVWRLRR